MTATYKSDKLESQDEGVAADLKSNNSHRSRKTKCLNRMSLVKSRITRIHDMADVECSI